MKDQPLVEDIKIQYKKSHHKPKRMKGRAVEIIVVAIFIIVIALLWIFAEQK